MAFLATLLGQTLSLIPGEIFRKQKKELLVTFSQRILREKIPTFSQTQSVEPKTNQKWAKELIEIAAKSEEKLRAEVAELSERVRKSEMRRAEVEEEVRRLRVTQGNSQPAQVDATQAGSKAEESLGSKAQPLLIKAPGTLVDAGSKDADSQIRRNDIVVSPPSSASSASVCVKCLRPCSHICICEECVPSVRKCPLCTSDTEKRIPPTPKL